MHESSGNNYGINFFQEGMYAAPVISGGALLGPTNITSHTGTLPSQLTMNRNRATGNVLSISPTYCCIEEQAYSLPPMHTHNCIHKYLLYQAALIVINFSTTLL